MSEARVLCVAAACAAMVLGGSVYAEQITDTEGLDLTDLTAPVDASTTRRISGSPSKSGYGPDKLFDNLAPGDDSRWISTADEDGCWWAAYEFMTPTLVNAYGLAVPKYYIDRRTPQQFKFQGSNDSGMTWTTLDEESIDAGKSWQTGEWVYFKFKNFTAYTTYRLLVTKTNDTKGDVNAQLSEMEFYRLAGKTSFTVSADPSELGSVVPAYGAGEALTGEPLTFSASETWTSPDDDAEATCTGYTVYKKTAGVWTSWLTGASASVTIDSMPEDDVRVEWHFSGRAKVLVREEENGGASGTGWYDFGSTASVTAQPAEGYRFVGWVNELDGTFSADNPLAVTCRGATYLHPYFVPASSSARFVSTTGDDERDGHTLAAAKASIKSAVESLGEAGGVVFVAAGSYTEVQGESADMAKGSTAVGLSAPVRIVGMTGDPRDVIVMRSTASNARVFELDNAGAGLQYVTVKGGRQDYGGNVRITANGGTVADCILTGGIYVNGHISGGGNIALYGGRVVRSVIQNGTAGSNDWGANGGGFWMKAGVIENSLICGNKGRYAAGVVAGSARLVNCTVVGNTFSSAGYSAGVYVEKDARVVNSIIAGNVNSADASITGSVFSLASGADVDIVFVHCASPDGEDAINESCYWGPIGFKDSDNGDYTLSVSSAVRDLGVPAEDYGAVSTTDLDGNARVAGTAVDLGCYEFKASGLVGDFRISADSYLVPATVTLAATVEGASGPVSYTWTMDDGNVDHRQVVTTAEPTYVWTCTAPGTYTITLSAESSGKRMDEIAHDVQTAPVVLYVVKDNAQAAYPYDTEATAAATIRTALGAALDGSVIHVAAGEYAISESLLVEKGVTILGDGPSTTRVVSSAGQRAVQISSATALVANLALEVSGTKDVSGSGGTVLITGGGGTLSNCVVKCHSVTGWTNGGAGISAQNGLVTHCEVIGGGKISTGDTPNNGIAVLLRNSAKMDNSLIHDIRGCTVDRSGGCIVSVVGSQIENCTIVDCLLPDPVAGYGTGHGSGLYVDATSTAKNCVVCGVKANEITNEIPEGGEKAVVTVVGEAALTCPWSGVADNFTACATDGETVINASCRLATTAAFADYAAGNYVPAEHGALYDAGTLEGLQLFSPTDFAGRPRIQHANRIDIGCYECVPRSGMAVVIR